MRTVLAMLLVAGVVSWTCPPAAHAQAAQPPATAQAAPPAPAAFPAATKVAFMDPDRIFAGSAEGKRLSAPVQEYRKQKVAELGEKTKRLEGLQTKRGQTTTADALAVLEREITRLNVDIERAGQDAEAEFNERMGRAQNEFRQKLTPVLEALLKEKGIHVLLTPGGGVAWVEPGIDLTAELIRRLDAVVAAPKTKRP